ncbi:hypothetical protein KDU71_17565 [Carboxylicivirga sediminis]|uniref:Uncharacterized protein n=1 Tax=Carboxylicivirga sediminis TaxID=2006564 RepID=A0A941F971_9BACT|nr:hypothetical protein [Carboxylicivirga sediminis]MBR8537380.1 hypothetical protein [Carboxylicivirga sediminis]
MGIFGSKINFTLFKSSILYSIAEGASKGGFQILLLIIASFIANDVYLVLMLLLGLEALMKMVYVTFYGNVLYKLIDLFPSKSILNVFFVISLLQLGIFIILLLLFNQYIFAYYSYDNQIVFILLAANAFIANLSVYYSVILQLQERHSEAVKYRSLPFFIGFVVALGGVMVLEDKVLGFFLGKFLGFLFFYIIFLARKITFSSFSLRLIKPVLKEMKGRVSYSFFIAIMGWLSSLGFMYVAKLWNTDDDLVILGYIINVYNVLFLFGYGINQVYSPRVKDLIVRNNYVKANRLKWNILVLYFLISLLMFVGLAAINSLVPLQTLFNGKLENISDILSVGYFSIFIFLANSFNWVVSPFYFSLDKFRQYFYLTAVSLILAFVGFYLGCFVAILNIGIGYAVFYFIKNLIPFVFSLKTEMT